MNAPATFGTQDNDFRNTVVGASEVAALFDASPWLTRFELWHRKAGNVATPDFDAIAAENERIEWGLRLERVIIDAACDRYGYQREETPTRLDNGAGLGGHPDQFVTCPTRGPGLVEVKTADWLVAKGWGDEPPLNYLLQVQAYLGLACRNWGDVVVLVGGNELRRFQYEFRPALYVEIEKRVAEFWASIRAGKAPKPDYSRDGDTIAGLHPTATDEVLDLRSDNRAHDLAATWLAASERKKAAEADAEAAKAELLDKLGGAGVALLEGMTVKCPSVAAVPDREITPDMVGQTIKGRKSYRRFSITEKK